jgi:hypothetical protein
LRVAGLALALTLLVMVALIGLKIATNADWRAVTVSSVRMCARQESAPDNSDPLPTAGHLVDCVARRNPVRNEPVELVTLAGLATLAAVEVGYLTRHH